MNKVENIETDDNKSRIDVISLNIKGDGYPVNQVEEESAPLGEEITEVSLPKSVIGKGVEIRSVANGAVISSTRNWKNISEKEITNNIKDIITTGKRKKLLAKSLVDKSKDGVINLPMKPTELDESGNNILEQTETEENIARGDDKMQNKTKIFMNTKLTEGGDTSFDGFKDSFENKSEENNKKEFTKVIREIKEINARLVTKQELYDDLRKSYSAVERKTAGILGKVDLSTLKEEAEITLKEITKLDHELKNEVNYLGALIKKDVSVFEGSEKEMAEIMEIEIVRNTIDNVQKTIDEKVGDIDEENSDNKYRVEIVVNSEVGLGGAIRAALERIDPMSGEDKVKDVFDNFTMRILKELSAEGMSHNEAIEAYKAMIKSLEISNGVIMFEKNDDGTIEASIINNDSRKNNSQRKILLSSMANSYDN